MKKPHIIPLLTAGATSTSFGVIQFTTGSPVSVSVSVFGDDTSAWNIDGSGDKEIDLYAYATVPYAEFRDPEIGFNFATIGTNLALLTASSTVDSLDGFGMLTEPRFSIDNGSIDAGDFQNLPNGTPSLVGFRFDPGSGLLYGVASITWSASGASSLSLTVNEWAYNDVVGEGIKLNGTGVAGATAVPESKHFAMGLGALALGAAGILRRKRSA